LLLLPLSLPPLLRLLPRPARALGNNMLGNTLPNNSRAIRSTIWTTIWTTTTTIHVEHPEHWILTNASQHANARLPRTAGSDGILLSWTWTTRRYSSPSSSSASTVLLPAYCYPVHWFAVHCPLYPCPTVPAVPSNPDPDSGSNYPHWFYGQLSGIKLQQHGSESSRRIFPPSWIPASRWIHLRN